MFTHFKVKQTSNTQQQIGGWYLQQNQLVGKHPDGTDNILLSSLSGSVVTSVSDTITDPSNNIPFLICIATYAALRHKNVAFRTF